MTDKVPEWAERAAREILLDCTLEVSPRATQRIAAIILHAIGSENLRKLERYPEMVMALREAESRLTYYVDGGDFAMPDDTARQLEGTRDDIRAALAGEPEEGA